MTNSYDTDMIGMLLGDLSFETFRQEFWNRQMNWVRGRGSEAFARCVTLSDLDHMISHLRLPLGNFDMAYEQEPLTKEAYCRDGLICPDRVFSLHREGVTIILRSAHFWLPGLNQLRCEAERAFGCPVQANVYLTPPNNQSTPPHWDTHDLFVLQILGAKLWPLFENTINPRPLSHERFVTNVDPVGKPTETLRLEAGDSLYLPRGMIHAPVSVGYSVHIALGLASLRWIDVARGLLDLSLPLDSPLREPVATFDPIQDRGDAAGRAAKALQGLFMTENLSATAAGAVWDLDKPTAAPTLGQLTRIAGLDRGAAKGEAQLVPA